MGSRETHESKVTDTEMELGSQRASTVCVLTWRFQALGSTKDQEFVSNVELDFESLSTSVCSWIESILTNIPSEVQK